MKNKVFYGEYSLMRWIEMILRQEIKLPEYQRYFVWEEKDALELIDNFCDDQFVPPVTIGAYNKDGVVENYILDGQQRLTSILLNYLMIFPNKDKFKTLIDNPINEDDRDFDEDEIEEMYDKLCTWTFRELTKCGKTKEQILNTINRDMYRSINEKPIPDSVYKSKFLGFCYLVPQTDNQKAQQKYYSSVFRNINKGISLTPQERRDALFFLDSSKVFFFKPEFAQKINFSSAKDKIKRLDFVRYLSLLSQYKKNNSFSKLARGYRTKMEDYYDEYIYDIVGEKTSEMFAPYNEVFQNVDIKARMDALSSYVQNLGYSEKAYESVINVDLDFFGLVYYVLFEGRTVNMSDKDKLSEELINKANEYKNDRYHPRNPAALKYLRARIENSISIYGKYLQ